MFFATLSSRKLYYLIAAAVVLGVVIWLIAKLVSGTDRESTNDAYVTADFTLVAPRVAGQISEVLVADNQLVRAGELLVRIDNRDFRAALSSAQADVVAAKAAVANHDAEIARHPSLVDQARATLRGDEASIAFARANAARYRNLSDAGAGTTQEQQQSSSALAEQLAQLSRDQAALAATEQNLGVLRAQRDNAAGSLEHAGAVLDQ